MIQVHATLTLALAWEACHNDLHKEMKDLGTYVAERERLRLFTGAMGAGWVTLWVCAVTGWSGGQEATGRHVGVCGGQEATSRLLGVCSGQEAIGRLVGVCGGRAIGIPSRRGGCPRGARAVSTCEGSGAGDLLVT